MDALIGFTGFVGSILSDNHTFEAKFNSKNINSSAGMNFDHVVCAAAPGSMFEANRFPERDLARIESLISQLSCLKTKRFTLISSIAVLDHFDAGYDEKHFQTQSELAYGRNRARLEQACAEMFESVLILRLPALFGTGLKKNFIFDMLNLMPSILTEEKFLSFFDIAPVDIRSELKRIYTKNAETMLFHIDRSALEAGGKRALLEVFALEYGYTALQFTNPKSSFQFYDMNGLWRDIQRGIENNLSLMHLAPPPLEAGRVYKVVNGMPMPDNSARLHSEDMHTRYSRLWDISGPYICDEATILEQLTAFFSHMRGTVQ